MMISAVKNKAGWGGGLGVGVGRLLFLKGSRDHFTEKVTYEQDLREASH